MKEHIQMTEKERNELQLHVLNTYVMEAEKKEFASVSAHSIAIIRNYYSKLLDEVERINEQLTEKDEAIEEERINAQEWEDEYMSLKRRFDELDKSALETHELLRDSSAQVVRLRKTLEYVRGEFQLIGEKITMALDDADEMGYRYALTHVNRIANNAFQALGEGDKE